MSEPIAPAPAPKKRFNLETATNIAIILLCIIASTVLVRNFFFTPKPPPRPGEAKPGDSIEAVKAILPAGSQKALVVAISPTCGYCTQSMPFYKRLMEERDKKGSPVRVVGAVPAPEAKAAEEQHMNAAGVKFDNLADISFQSIKVPATPTLILVDGTGKVEKVWVGKLDEDGEEEVFKVL